MFYHRKDLILFKLFSFHDWANFVEKPFHDPGCQLLLLRERLPDFDDGVVERDAEVVDDGVDSRVNVVWRQVSNDRESLTLKFVTVDVVEFVVKLFQERACPIKVKLMLAAVICWIILWFKSSINYLNEI